MVEVWVHTPDYSARTAIVAESGAGWVFDTLTLIRKENQVTELALTLPYQPGIVELFPLDARLEVYDDGRLEGETQWFVRVPPKLTYADDGALLVEVRAECALYLLAGRIVAYAAGSPETTKSGPADDLIKAIVRENLGALAPADRDLSAYLDVADDAGQGALVHKTMPRRNVLLVCQEIARASAQAGIPLFFDIVWTGSRLELRTYRDKRGADHRVDSPAPIVLSPEFGTLVDASRSFDHRDEATVVYCAGQGQGDQRLIVSVSDDARRTATPFNRREIFVDARYLSLADSIATKADAALWRRRPVQQIGGTFADTEQWRYSRDWAWGDLTSAEFNGEILTVRVHAVTLTVARGQRRIAAELRADSTEADDAVRRIEGQLDAHAADELPLFTTDPTPGAAPLADAAGQIDDGWLSAAIARLSDIPTALSPTGSAGGDLGATYPSPRVVALQGVPVEDNSPGLGEILVGLDGGWALSNISGVAGVSETPGVYRAPLAGTAGTIADGWLSAAIARVADLTWANLGGKPSTFAPSAHASAHASGGVDPLTPSVIGASAVGHGHTKANITDLESISASPAAAAIPKAGAGGTLADSWLSSAIARVVDLTWTNVSGKPATFAPSAHASSHASGGGDPLTPAAIGAATSGHTHAAPDWSAITGKPSTFAPSAHAASHQHGGGDEIATAIAAANAIPKAGAGGTLADGWLSANIPRLNAANTFSAAQILTLTHATANTTLGSMTYNMLCSTTPAAGFGQDHSYNLESDAGTNRAAALQRVQWAVATDASRRSRVQVFAFDAGGARECLRLEASGVSPIIGFNGVAAVARQSLAALTVSVGTSDGVVADVGAAFNQATLNNNFRDLADKINQVRTLLVNVGLAV